MATFLKESSRAALLMKTVFQFLNRTPDMNTKDLPLAIYGKISGNVDSKDLKW